MIDRALFTPDGSNPPYPVPLSSTQTVPTEEMAHLFASLVGSGSVLEIGTGSGYQTAVLAEQCSVVVTIEIEPIPGTAELLPANVAVIEGDGLTYDTGEQFDAVLVTCAATRIAHSWFRQVREGGKLVVPLRTQGSGLCRVCVYEKQQGSLILQDIPLYAPFTAAQES